MEDDEDALPIGPRGAFESLLEVGGWLGRWEKGGLLPLEGGEGRAREPDPPRLLWSDDERGNLSETEREAWGGVGDEGLWCAEVRD